MKFGHALSLITHPAAIRLRNILRASGLAGPIRKVLAGENYEEKVEATLLSALRPGDVVWDVGANVATTHEN